MTSGEFDNALRIRASSADQWPDCARREAARGFAPLIADVTGYALRQTTPGVAAAIGSAVHRAAEYTLSYKLEYGSIGSDRDAEELTVGTLHKELENGVAWDRLADRMSKAEKQARRMTKAYRTYTAPATSPIAVEHNLKADIGDGFLLTGRADAMTFLPSGIQDLKTGTRQRTHHGQIGSYGILATAHGYDARVLEINFIKRVGERTVQPTPVVTHYDPDSCMEIARTRLRMVKEMITKFRRTGRPDSFPANPASYLCSDKFCPAWGTKWCTEHIKRKRI